MNKSNLNLSIKVTKKSTYCVFNGFRNFAMATCGFKTLVKTFNSHTYGFLSVDQRAYQKSVELQSESDYFFFFSIDKELVIHQLFVLFHVKFDTVDFTSFLGRTFQTIVQNICLLKKHLHDVLCLHLQLVLGVQAHFEPVFLWVVLSA